ncbi:YybH family protein [Elongatibacter sediminis]|uniref:Nuclear transport factor 2 family protein n=1 Tax=Elongatibacter sediminis TaxID=3119006 RepID=A0AAW9R6G1_9GAMM
MIRSRFHLSFLVFGIASVFPVPALPGASGVAQAREEIIETRGRYNDAIERRDAAAMSGLFAPDFLLITGRGDRFNGRSTHLDLWESTFASDPSFSCRRTPEQVSVNVEWGLAQETGRWVCDQTVEGEAGHYSGVFAARWQRSEDGGWLLRSEVFTTLGCHGPAAACRPPEPVSGGCKTGD